MNGIHSNKANNTIANERNCYDFPAALFFFFLEVNFVVFQFLSAVCQMDINNEECKKTFSEVSGVLGSTPYEALQSVIHLLFKSASQCQCIPRAVCIST
jgi:hypothetical protein